MRILFLTLLFIIFAFQAEAQEFSVSQIPDSLKENAYSVIRDYKMEVRMASPKEGEANFHITATILNKKGKSAADFVFFSDMFRNLYNFRGELYNAEGEKILSLKKTDLKKMNLSDNLASDDNTFFYDCPHEIYPFTVSYEWSVKFKRGILSFPAFSPISSFNQSLEKAQYTLKVPKEMKTDYKANGIGKPIQHEEKDAVISQWNLTAIKALEHEPFGPSIGQLVPCLYVQPMDFVYDKYAGNQSTWENLSAWHHSLLIGRDVLTPELQAQIKSLVKDTDSNYEKVKKLYTYLGENMRYVSIQLGIGGLQPMKASETARMGFGDCKALSYYLKVMLAQVGIESEYVVISTTHSKLYDNYPNVQQMNHVILKVPLKERTLWLECTNPFIPFGYIHESIAGHDALIVRPNGGGLERLPYYADSLHIQTYRVEVDLTDSSQTNAQVTCTSHLSQYESTSILLRKKPEDRKDIIRRKLNLTRAIVDKIDIFETQDSFPTLVEHYNIKSMYGNKNGNRFFLPVNPFRQEPFRLSEHERSQQIVMSYGYVDRDTIIVNIPNNYVIETKPKDMKMSCSFGQISSRIQIQENKMIIIQELRRYKGIYPPEKIKELIIFSEAIRKAYNAKVILKKKD